MENIGPVPGAPGVATDPAAPDRSGLGPAPAAVDPAELGLSAARGEILDRLIAAGAGGLGVAEAARRAGLHENTVREHLDALVRAGLADRARARTPGRGRPAWRYTALPDRALGARAREYAALAAALAVQIARTSPEPGPGAVRAGEEWGRELSAGRPPAADGTAGARRRLVEAFDLLGFAPRADAAGRTIRLTRCPLLEVARRHPEVVCAVHLGIARGVLAAEGARPDGAVLRPFAEPGACLLGLAGG